MKKGLINWKQLIEEVKKSLDEGANTKVALATGYWLERLKNAENWKSQQVLDELWKLLP